MKIDHDKMSGRAFPGGLKIAGGLLVSCALLMGTPAAEAATFSGDSTTILRARETSTDRTLIPLYEYLHVTGANAFRDGTLSIHLGGWGRGDLADDTTRQNNNGDLQYGFLSYQGNKSNLQFNLGRQFITDGVAAGHLDGLYVKSDFLAGVTGSAFIGVPAATEPNFKGGVLMYGGRIAHSMPKLYSIGLSALWNREIGDDLREEEGIDLWLHPMQQVDIAGRSSYNSRNGGWMEHYYTFSMNPLDIVRLSFTLEQIKYRHYFYHVTTSAFSLTNGLIEPGERLLALGGSVAVTPIKNLSVSVDYKNYDYDIMGQAHYYGGGASYALANNFSAGLTFHRMDGSEKRFRYNEYHAYATKKIGRGDVTLDFFDVDFDNSINRISNTYAITAAAGYDFPRNVRVAADIDYARTIDTDNDVRGLFKVIYVFGSEGRAK